ncbi:TDP-N-acetylfucosamine:lipid II N-acetylfucosaminyltransferase [Aliarcobacter cryaerophilus]|uniref:TDP-N-acetylfucosamine:lipid II N-acetylfucosaminyltransferase n=1 Tax=Aliarcobacter cryaerophilus TaxID=28198 RepID=UPI003BAE4286
MNENKILHVMILDKFLAPFIDFVDENFGRENHHYVFITSEKYECGLTPEHKVEFLYTDDDIFITLLEYMKMAKKIILHGLWRDKVDILLYFNQELLKKCYWAMWGGDFYFPETKSKIRHEIIKNMGYCLTTIMNDYDLVKKQYKTKAKLVLLHVGYPSNLYKEYKINKKEKNTINIQIGNSATSTNNHIEILKKLLKYKNEDIQIFAPLSYGDKEYAKEVMDYGKKAFGDKFIALTEFMPFEKYLEFLGSIDIAIFNHKRQQAMGNTITLLGLGKKVYMRNDVTPFKLFSNIGVKIFDVENIELNLLDKETKKSNQDRIKSYFSKNNLLEDCKIYLN